MLISCVLLRGGEQKDANSPKLICGAGHTLGPLCSGTRRHLYPPEALAAGIEGTVILGLVTGKTGRAESITVVSGPEQLRQSAIDEVKSWRWKPRRIHGHPVSARTTVQVNYTIEKNGDQSSR